MSQPTIQITQHKSPAQQSATVSKSEPDTTKPSKIPAVILPIPEASPDPDLMAWKKEFLAFFSTIKGFCKHYFRDSYNRDIPMYMHNNHKHLMVEMAEAIYPGHPSVGYSHATHLLRDPNDRPLLVMRMLVQHLLEGTFGKGNWTGFDKETDEELARIKTDLLTTHQPGLRKALLAQRANILTKMKSNTPQWQAFRHNVVTVLSQRARMVFWPFLPTDGTSPPIRDEAGYDFRNAVETIVDLAFRAMEAEQDFSFTYAGCRVGERFDASRHKAGVPDMEDTQFEDLGYRLKLGMTPVVSARINREMVLVPQTVCKATVLVLR